MLDKGEGGQPHVSFHAGHLLADEELGQHFKAVDCPSHWNGVQEKFPGETKK